MKYSVRTLLLATCAVAVLLAVAVPLVRHLSHDPVATAVIKLRNEDAIAVKLVDNGEWLGRYASVQFAGVSKKNIDLRAVKIVDPDVVDLSGTGWTDDDLPKLYEMDVAQIILTDTEVTPLGLRDLRARLSPDVKVLADY
jgi:hypothetical protein